MELRKTNFNGTPCWLYRLHLNVSAGPPGGGACPYVVQHHPQGEATVSDDPVIG
jgi:hypothetical protein